MTTLILESGARTLALATAVWIALRLLRLRNVVAQKIAWSVVLAAAIAMPFLMRWRVVQIAHIAIPSSWTTPVHRADPVYHVAPPAVTPTPQDKSEAVSV